MELSEINYLKSIAGKEQIIYNKCFLSFTLNKQKAIEFRKNAQRIKPEEMEKLAEIKKLEIKPEIKKVEIKPEIKKIESKPIIKKEIKYNNQLKQRIINPDLKDNKFISPFKR